jgi:hypothetical protein
VIGEWCNLGLATNSNLKKTSAVKVWTPKEKNAGKKCGVFMGDYSKHQLIHL